MTRVISKGNGRFARARADEIDERNPFGLQGYHPKCEVIPLEQIVTDIVKAKVPELATLVADILGKRFAAEAEEADKDGA